MQALLSGDSGQQFRGKYSEENMWITAGIIPTRSPYKPILRHYS
jgi:hypothetical protein